MGERQPAIIVTDTYDRKTGKHVSSVCKTQDGRVVWEKGADAAKDVAPFLDLDRPWPNGESERDA
jgi:hypothetical protein